MKTKKKSLFAWFGRTVAVGLVPLMMFGCAGSDGDDGKDAVADNSTSTGGTTVVNQNPPTFSTDPSGGNVITGTSVLKVSFGEAVTSVTNGTNVVLKNGSGIVATMDHTAPTSGNTYTFDPNPDLVSGTYYLSVGAGIDIKDSDGQAALPQTIVFSVDDARTTAKAAMSDAGVSVTAATAAGTAADNATNNLMSVIPAAMGAGIDAATTSADKQLVISSLIGSANGAASLTSSADRTITRINDATGFATLLELIGDTLAAQAIAGKLTAAEFETAITTVNTALTAAGADSDQLSGLQSGFNSAIDNDVSTAVSAGTLTTAYTTAVTTATGTTSSGSTGSTFNLSANLDAGADFIGTANNDTYYASDTTLTAGDNLDGGDGTDTVILSWALSAAEAVSAFTFANIETLTTSVADADTGNAHTATMSLAGVTGLTTLNVDGSTEANANDDTLTVTNIPSGVTLGINSTNLNINATYVTGATSGTGDTVALTLSGAASAAANDSNIDVAAGFESATLTTSGSASAIGDLDFNGATSITVSGDQNLTIRGGLEDAVVTVNASSMTGALSIVSGNAAEASSGTTDFTFTGGAGNDVADLTGMDANDEISFAGGAGDDRVVTNDEINETGDSFDGGEGTADIIAVGADLDADFSDVVSNFEILELTTAGVTYATLSEFSGTQFTVSAEDAAADNGGVLLLSMDAMTSGATVTLNPTGAANAVTQEDGATDDGIEVNISLATDATSGDSITIDAKAGYEEISDDAEDDFETVTFKYTGTSAGVVDLLDFGNASTVTLEATGAALTLTSGVFKADADITATTSTQNITATFSTNGLNSYAGGTGNDAITLGVAGDLKQGNTFSDAGGTDSLAGTATASQDLGLVAATGFETITLTSNAAGGDTVTADLRNVTGLTTFAVTGGDDGDSFTIQRLHPDTTFTLTDTITNATLTLQSGTTHKVGASATGVVDGTLTLDAGATTLEIDTSSASVRLDAVAGGSLATVTASGSNALTISAMPANAVTVNASSMTAALTYVGGTAVDTVTGSSVADTIQNTASGANTTAADVLTGGAGFDTFTFIGSAASSTSYAGVPNVTDFTVSATAGQTDLIRLSSADTDYAAGLSVDGTAAGASGTVGVLDIAQNSGATDSGSSSTNEFIKLTTSTGFSTNHQGTFNAAIGTSTVTNLTAGTYAVSYHDSTNNKMVILEVATADTTLGTGDVVRVIGTIDMSASDYANIDADNFANFL